MNRVLVEVEYSPVKMMELSLFIQLKYYHPEHSTTK